MAHDNCVTRTSAHLKIRMETTPFPQSHSPARKAVINFYTRGAPKERSTGAISIEDSDDESELVPPKGQPEDVEAKKGTLVIPKNSLLHP